MPALDNPRKELFCNHYAKGLTAGEAYVMAGYSPGGAGQAAFKLLKNAQIQARIAEVKASMTAKITAGWISERVQRIARLQDTANKLLSVFEARARCPEHLAGAGGETGLLCVDFKGRDADRPVYRVDVGSLKELRETMRQAAIELGQWEERSDHTLHGPDNGPIQLEESAIIARLHELGHGVERA